MRVVINSRYGGFEISEECAKWLTLHGLVGGADYFNYTYDLEHREEFRSHPLLVRAVEALGDKVNTDECKLKIVEVPDDVKWHIEDYDGNEWVAEDHRTWS